MLLYPGDDIDDPHYIRAYHWASFGSTEGILIDTIDIGQDSVVLTSFVNRTSIHLLSLDIRDQSCKSVAFNITKKATEFTFKEKGGANSSQKPEATTLHNSLIDCHADVWTRFPVVAAVTHRGICQNLTFGMGEPLSMSRNGDVKVD